MSLLAGTRLGPYEILAPIGAGGMGEVYRGKDTKLDRNVAVKILPDALTHDPERLARFEREAKVLAALNHPKIAQIYAVEQGALVMELVEGVTLKGPLPLDTAFNYAKQIAEALEAAHEKGIVHRDLKPANIMITPDGTVKVLDFGLAKVADTPASDPQNSPTITMSETQTGVILGTAAYMAPEQARGKSVDRRADIWAFGVVLYEMLTGEHAFKGDSAAELLGAVIHKEPNLDRVPVKMRRLLESCLQKDPKQRLQAIGDWRLLIQDVPEGEAPIAQSPPRSQIGMWIAWTTAGAMALVAGVLGFVHFREPAPREQSFALTILPPKDLQLPPIGSQVGPPLISPDGTSVLTLSGLRNLNSLQFVPVRGMERFGEPFWSPDSKWAAFLTGSGKLRKVQLPDGAPEDLTPTPGPSRGGAWRADGTILLAALSSDGLSLFVLPPGGAFKELTVPGLPPGPYFHPEFLPNGFDFLFFHRPSGSRQGAVYLATLKDGRVVNPTRLLQNDTAAHYTPAGGGQLLFVRNDSLYTQHLDLRARRLNGEPEAIQQGVGSVQAFAVADFSVSRTGVVVWRPGTQPYSEVTSFDRQGKVVGTSGSRGGVEELRLSPDETHLLVNEGAAGSFSSELLETGRPGSSGLGENRWSVWSPDGTRLLGARNGKIVERSLSGPGETRIVADAPGIGLVEDVSPDGKVALYSVVSSGVRSVFSVRLDGSGGSPIAVVPTGEQIYTPRFSSNGKWVVYNANQDIYVQPFPGPGLRRHIATGGSPVWRGDGKEIIYGRRGGLSSIPVTKSAADIRFGTPVELFPVRALNTVAGLNPLAVTRDGSRIFFPQAAEQPDVPDVIHVMSGWGFKKP